MELTKLQLDITKRYLSRIGWALFAMMGISIGIQVLIGFLVGVYSPAAAEQGWYTWVMMVLCNYTVSVLAAVLILSTVPPVHIPKRSIRVSQFFVALLICYSFMLIGNLIGLGVTGLMGQVSLSQTGNPVFDLLAEGDFWLGMPVVCICAPVVEELVFRKLLIDRLARYGQWVAVFASALLFGLFHGNFSQFFYAFLAGFVFGYVYVKTGKIWYSMLLHAIINSVPFAAMALLGSGSVVLILLLALLLFCGATAGIALLVIKRKQIRFAPRVSILPQKRWGRIVFGNPGMVMAILICAVMFFINSAGIPF